MQIHPLQGAQPQLQLLCVGVATYLVDGYGTGIVLVGALCVDEFCCQCILPACIAGCAWCRCGGQVVAVNVEHWALALEAFASHSCCWCASEGRTGCNRVVAVRRLVVYVESAIGDDAMQFASKQCKIFEYLVIVEWCLGKTKCTARSTEIQSHPARYISAGVLDVESTAGIAPFARLLVRRQFSCFLRGSDVARLPQIEPDFPEPSPQHHRHQSEPLFTERCGLDRNAIQHLYLFSREGADGLWEQMPVVLDDFISVTTYVLGYCAI